MSFVSWGRSFDKEVASCVVTIDSVLVFSYPVDDTVCNNTSTDSVSSKMDRVMSTTGVTVRGTRQRSGVQMLHSA